MWVKRSRAEDNTTKLRVAIEKYERAASEGEASGARTTDRDEA